MSVTMNLILSRLQQRVSKNNAKLLLDTAKIKAGLDVTEDAVLETEQAKEICLKLISQGGPSFQVGQAVYKEYLA